MAYKCYDCGEQFDTPVYKRYVERHGSEIGGETLYSEHCPFCDSDGIDEMIDEMDDPDYDEEE